jgi:hypothetical protein
MGVLSNSLKYWLLNYNQTRHILLSSKAPFSSEDLIVVPSERDKIITASKDRRHHAMGRSTPSHTSQRSSKTKHKSPKKILNLSTSPTATTKSIRTTLQIENIRTYMTPVRNERAIELIDIPTTETSKLRDERDATNIDDSETEPKLAAHQINAVTMAASSDQEKVTPTSTKNARINNQANVDEVVTAPKGTIEVLPVPIVPNALDTTLQALLLMAATASIVDVTLTTSCTNGG